MSNQVKNIKFSCKLLDQLDDEACSVLDIGPPNIVHTTGYNSNLQGSNETYWAKNIEEMGEVRIQYLLNDNTKGYKSLEAAYNLLMDPLRNTKEKEETGVYTRMSSNGSKVIQTVNMARCVVNAVEMDFTDKKSITMTLTVLGLRSHNKD